MPLSNKLTTHSSDIPRQVCEIAAGEILESVRCHQLLERMRNGTQEIRERLVFQQVRVLKEAEKKITPCKQGFT